MPRANRTADRVDDPNPAAQLESLVRQFEAKDQKLIRAVRSAMRKRLPTAHELLYDYGSFFVIAYSPTEKPYHAVVSIAARADGMQLYFMHGPKLPDPKKMLQGSGKQARFIGLESAKTLERPEVTALMNAAIARAEVPLPDKGKGTLIVRSTSAKRRRQGKAG